MYLYSSRTLHLSYFASSMLSCTSFSPLNTPPQGVKHNKNNDKPPSHRHKRTVPQKKHPRIHTHRRGALSTNQRHTTTTKHPPHQPGRLGRSADVVRIGARGRRRARGSGGCCVRRSHWGVHVHHVPQIVAHVLDGVRSIVLGLYHQRRSRKNGVAQAGEGSGGEKTRAKKNKLLGLKTTEYWLLYRVYYGRDEVSIRYIISALFCPPSPGIP